MKKILLVMLMLVVGLVGGCGGNTKTEEIMLEDTIAKIVLTSNKTEIIADGTDKVTFAVKYYNELGNEIIGSGVKIYLGSEEIATGSFTATVAREYVFRAELGNIKSENLIINAKEVAKLTKIDLTSDKKEITANGTDKATFIVKCYDQYNNVISVSDIKLYSNETEQTSMIFKTEKSGTYKITAKSGEVISNEIIVTAKETPKLAKIELTADETDITANGIDTVYFTVKCYDQYNAKINVSDVKLYKNSETIGQSALNFSSNTAGSYKITAKSGEIISNEISVTVKPQGELAKIVLSATKTEILSDGKDSATFSIWYYDKDDNRISDCGAKIYNIKTNEEVTNLVFKTTVEGEYSFYAKTDKIQTLKAVTITAMAGKYYNETKRMLGTWTMTYYIPQKTGSVAVRKVYTFNKIFVNVDGIYIAEANGTLAGYTGSKMIIDDWSSDNNGYGYVFEFENNYKITGRIGIIKNGSVINEYDFVGTK